MRFGHLIERLRPVSSDEANPRFQHRRRGAFGQIDPEVRAQLLEPEQELRPGENGGCGDGDVGLRTDHRLELDLPTIFEELPFQAGWIGELIGDHKLAWLLFEHVLDRPCVPPGEQLVEVPELGVKLVIFRRSNRHHRVRASALDVGREPDRNRIGELFRVFDSFQFREMLGPHVTCRNHERAEEIPLPALIHADMPLVHWAALYPLKPMADTKPTSEGDWTSYYEVMESKPLHPQYEHLDPLLEPGWNALELGCGVGHGVAHLIEKGLVVTGVDAQPDALERLRRRLPEGARPTLICSTFQSLELPVERFDLVVAGFCLFFLTASDFASFWPKLIGSLKPGGLFMGQILGPNDEWADEEHSFHTREQVDALLSGFEVLRMEEVDQDGARADGTPKHWHVFHILARKR